jgi:hypothetical protein
MNAQIEKVTPSDLPLQVTKLVVKGNMPLLKAWRIHLGIPLGVAAEKSGVNANILAGMERNENSLTEELKKVAQALGVNVDLLVDSNPMRDQSDIYG